MRLETLRASTLVVELFSIGTCTQKKKKLKKNLPTLLSLETQLRREMNGINPSSHGLFFGLFFDMLSHFSEYD